MNVCTKCAATSDAYLCRNCSNRLREQLSQIPWLANRLAEAHSKSTNLAPAPTRAVKPSSEDEEQSPVPYDGRARALYDQLRTACMRWVRDFCEQQNVEFMPINAVPANFVGPLRKYGQWRMRDGYVPRTRDLAAWLHANHLNIVNSEDAGLCADEIGQAVDASIQALNGPLTPMYCGPCPTVIRLDDRGQPQTCDQALYARRGGEAEAETHVTCWRCRERYDVAQLKQSIYARADNFLLTATEILRVLNDLGEHLPRNRFYDMKNAGDIPIRGWMHDGRIVQVRIYNRDAPVFSLGEVRRLAATAATRREQGPIRQTAVTCINS